jgi:deazaflavin-dependent oxidoreductase (nitroreductase family)
VAASETLADRLGYRFRRPNLFQRGLQAFAGTRAGAWLFSKTLAPMDRALSKVTGGRATVPAVFAGLPVLVLTSTGRRSGRPTAAYLIAVPHERTLALLGTNFGQPRTPAWVYNLEAEPRATVAYRGRVTGVVARPASDAERATVLANSRSVYSGYAKYQQRITGRTLRIFVLEPG